MGTAGELSLKHQGEPGPPLTNFLPIEQYDGPGRQPAGFDVNQEFPER